MSTTIQDQLYNRHEQLEIPATALITAYGNRVHNYIFSAFPYMRWPNGKPCMAMNAYMLSKKGYTGDSLITDAAKLVHLVRFCYCYELRFDQVGDAHIFQLANELLSERNSKNPLMPARSRRRVREILFQCIDFFFWYQKELWQHQGLLTLIGEPHSSPQITVIGKKNTGPGRRRSRNEYWEHLAMPTADSLEEKRPIPTQVIEQIEAHIEEKAIFGSQSKWTLRREPDIDHFKAKLEYIRARRRFTVWMFRRVGLRPQECQMTTCSEQRDVLNTNIIKLRTAKSRKYDAPRRSFPIQTKDAMVVKRYLAQRDGFVRHLMESGRLSEEQDALFLTESGTALSKETMTRDFARLVKEIGIGNFRVCLSMFRHRWITMEVLVHLKQFTAATGRGRISATNDDYRTILRKVADKTGHADPDSLWVYIDLAWEEAGVWTLVNDELERIRAIEGCYGDLLDLKKEIQTSEMSREQLVDVVTKRLESLISDISKPVQTIEI